MFFGTYKHNLDEKGRLMIPRKMRDDLGTKIYIMKGFDGALSIYKEDKFLKLVEQLENLPFNEKASRDYSRIQLASVCDLDVDKLGRIQLPTRLVEQHKISKEVTVIGAGDHIEVWATAAYEEYEKMVDANFETIAEHLKDAK